MQLPVYLSNRVARCIAPVLWRGVDRSDFAAFGPGRSLGYAECWILTSGNSPSRYFVNKGIEEGPGLLSPGPVRVANCRRATARERARAAAAHPGYRMLPTPQLSCRPRSGVW